MTNVIPMWLKRLSKETIEKEYVFKDAKEKNTILEMFFLNASFNDENQHIFNESLKIFWEKKCDIYGAIKIIKEKNQFKGIENCINAFEFIEKLKLKEEIEIGLNNNLEGKKIKL